MCFVHCAKAIQMGLGCKHLNTDTSPVGDPVDFWLGFVLPFQRDVASRTPDRRTQRQPHLIYISVCVTLT